MLTGYKYELWNGKEVLGTFYSTFSIRGKEVRVYEVAPYKQPYNLKPKIIIVPIITRLIVDTGIDRTYRICLDVRRKSKRQINILKGLLR